MKDIVRKAWVMHDIFKDNEWLDVITKYPDYIKTTNDFLEINRACRRVIVMINDN